MEGAVMGLDSQDTISDDGDIDVDSILQGFPCGFADDLNLLLSPVVSTLGSPKELEGSSSDSLKEPTPACSFAQEIENFLMEDGEGEAQVEDEGTFLDDFLADVLVDDGSGSRSDTGKSEVASPESGGLVEISESAAAAAARDGVAVIEEEERGEEEEDGQINKKRRRQMKNRESAMQSRERKKMYVKDLEMKSKYLESECRRLDYALRCCMAENAALHQHLQKVGAPAARQESAVLIMESLLLGSLFWLVSIVYLFLVPSLKAPNSWGKSREGRGLALEVVESKTVPSETSLSNFGSDLVIWRRRYRGLRTRMKALLFPSHRLSVEIF